MASHRQSTPQSTEHTHLCALTMEKALLTDAHLHATHFVLQMQKRREEDKDTTHQDTVICGPLIPPVIIISRHPSWCLCVLPSLKWAIEKKKQIGVVEIDCSR